MVGRIQVLDAHRAVATGGVPQGEILPEVTARAAFCKVPFRTDRTCGRGGRRYTGIAQHILVDIRSHIRGRRPLGISPQLSIATRGPAPVPSPARPPTRLHLTVRHPPSPITLPS